MVGVVLVMFGGGEGVARCAPLFSIPLILRRTVATARLAHDGYAARIRRQSRGRSEWHTQR